MGALGKERTNRVDCGPSCPLLMFLPLPLSYVSRLVPWRPSFPSLLSLSPSPTRLNFHHRLLRLLIIFDMYSFTLLYTIRSRVSFLDHATVFSVFIRLFQVTLIILFLG